MTTIVSHDRFKVDRLYVNVIVLSDEDHQIMLKTLNMVDSPAFTIIHTKATAPVYREFNIDKDDMIVFGKESQQDLVTREIITNHIQQVADTEQMRMMNDYASDQVNAIVANAPWRIKKYCKKYAKKLRYVDSSRDIMAEFVDDLPSTLGLKSGQQWWLYHLFEIAYHFDVMRKHKKRSDFYVHVNNILIYTCYLFSTMTEDPYKQ